MSNPTTTIEDVRQNLGRIVREYRQFNGLSQLGLGTLLGYSPKSAAVSICRLENGQSMPRISAIFTLADVMDVDAHRLFDPTFRPEPKKHAF